MTPARRRPVRVPASALALAGALAACSAPQDTPSAPAPADPPATAPAPASGPEVQRDCRLVVDGVTHVEGRCWVYPMGDGGLTLNTWTHGKPEQPHFAVVAVLRPGVANASWNNDPTDTHAWDRLGEVTLQDGCWTNARVRVCAQ